MTLSTEVSKGSFIVPPRLHEHLEVFKSVEGAVSDSLYSAVNRTKTPGGARKLKKYLQFPLKDPGEIAERWDKIDWWKARPALLESVRKTLAPLGDGERKLSKITQTYCHGRDLLAVGEVLSVGLQLMGLMEDTSHPAEAASAEKLKNQIFRAIRSTAPAGFKEGGVINKGIYPDLDKCMDTACNAQSRLSALERSERRKTGIPSLKIRYNNVFGYYIEITKAHCGKVPSTYRRKQTLTQAERYTTLELEALEGRVLSAKARQIQMEREIFQSLRRKVLDYLPRLLKLCDYWSETDVFSSLAFSAVENRYVRPVFGKKFLLVNGRHPVLEKKSFGGFVPNTVEITPGETLILTGPNMAGKSTLMRTVALSALLAQSGCFVPADRAVIPVFHKIFTRIGAGDSLTRGLSTFMVEMKEMAEILDRADSKSLIILDEIGRGTATFDGMSLARAAIEFLTERRKPVLLSATHYHELTALADACPSVYNGSMDIKEKDGEIRFLYTLSKGPANKSYGIQVARLAGLPPSVIRRSEKLLQKYESAGKRSSFNGQMDLFATPDSNLKEPEKKSTSNLLTANSLDLMESRKKPLSAEPAQNPLAENSSGQLIFREVLKEISRYSLNEVTPLDAMNQISIWQKKIKKSPGNKTNP